MSNVPDAGGLHNLYNCDYLDLEKPYWAQGFNEAASIGEAQYMWFLEKG